MRRSFASGAVLVTFFTTAQAADTVQDGFFENNKATLSLRTLGFLHDNRDGTAEPSKTEEWAQGFLLKYESGFTRGAIGFGIDTLLMTGVTLDSGRGRHRGGSMIPSDGDRAADTWTRFSPTVKARLDKTEVRLGALQPRLPILMANDGRVLPQTYEGIQVTSSVIDRFTLTGGVVEQAVGRASTDSTGLSVQGSTRDSNKFYFAGADWAVTGNLKAQYYFAQLDEFYTQHFIGLNHRLPLAEARAFTTDLRYFKTDSTGANSSDEGRAAGYRTSGYTRDGTGEIDNYTWSLSGTYTQGGHSLMLGYQDVSAGSNFVQPNQGGLQDKGAGGSISYLITERYTQNFNRAGEQTAYAQYAYDFAPMNMPGLKVSAMYLKGDNIKHGGPGGASEWERNFTLDYVIQEGVLKGVGFGWRNAKSHSDVSRNQDQNRALITYTASLI